MNFNNIFTRIGANLAHKAGSSNKHFNHYMTSCDIFHLTVINDKKFYRELDNILLKLFKLERG